MAVTKKLSSKSHSFSQVMSPKNSQCRKLYPWGSIHFAKFREEKPISSLHTQSSLAMTSHSVLNSGSHSLQTHFLFTRIHMIVLWTPKSVSKELSHAPSPLSSYLEGLQQLSSPSRVFIFLSAQWKWALTRLNKTEGLVTLSKVLRQMWCSFPVSPSASLTHLPVPHFHFQKKHTPLAGTTGQLQCKVQVHFNLSHPLTWWILFLLLQGLS